jgi:hypothetical protein
VDPFLIRWTDTGIAPQASELAYGCKGDWLDLKLSDGMEFTTEQKASKDPALFGAMPSSSKATLCTVTAARRVGPHDSPIRWRIASGGGAFGARSEHALGLSTRLRLSINGYGGSWVDQSKASGAVDQTLLSQLKNAPIDDISLVHTIQFDAARPGEVTWSDGLAPNGNTKLREPYLRDLIDRLHAMDIQVRAGYEVVEQGSQHTVLGNAFSKWILGKDKPPDIKGHIEKMLQFLWGKGLDFDGIGFDLEVNGLLLEHGPNLAKLIRGTAQALAPMNKFVTYDNAPSLASDGDNKNKFMTIQPYGLCRDTPNLVARPMCYNGAALSEGDMKKTVATALRATTSNGGAGLHPSQLQLAVRHWGGTSSLTKSDIIKRCNEILQPNRIGLVLYPIPIKPDKKNPNKTDLSAVKTFIADLAEYDKALNPKDPRGRAGQPLQVPRKPRS